MRTIAVLAAAACGAVAQDAPPKAAAPDAPVKLELRLPKGKSWAVTQTLRLQSDNTDAAGASVGEQTANPEIDLRETWTDRALADAGGRVKDLQRTWTAATARATHGETWEGAMPLVDAAVKLVAAPKATTATAAAGTPPAETLRLLAGAPPEAAAALLPAKAVKPGDGWDVPQPRAAAWVHALVAALPAVKPEGSLAFGLATIFRAVDGAAAIAPLPALRATFTSVAEGQATITATGVRVIPGQGTPPVGGGECRVDATLVLAVATGTPVRLQVTVTHRVAPGPGSGFKRSGPNGLEDVGLAETWTVARTYTRRE
jgi:hypothetical protein